MYAVEKCKISGYLGDQRSTSRQTHQAHENRENDLVLIMTPEKQDKTLELSKHWSADSTPARNEVIRSAITSATKEMSGVQEASSSSSHKEGSVSRKRRHEKDVNNLMSIIDRNMINPFSLDGITTDSEPIALCNIASRTVPGKDITDDLLGAYEKRFKRMNDFLKERLNTS